MLFKKMLLGIICLKLMTEGNMDREWGNMKEGQEGLPQRGGT